MPQMLLEYSAGVSLDILATLQALNGVLADTGLFSVGDIKTRAVQREHWLTGVEPGKAPFVHLQLYILSGRELSVRQQLSAQLLETLPHYITGPAGTQLCVEIRQIERESYRKLIL